MWTISSWMVVVTHKLSRAGLRGLVGESLSEDMTMMPSVSLVCSGDPLIAISRLGLQVRQIKISF